jgi:predicted nuclease with RNAse H fold
MLYCGIVASGPYHVLCALEEVRTDEPPIRLHATFFEPGPAEQVAAVVRAAGDAVVAIAAPISGPREGARLRTADEELRRRGVFPLAYSDEGRRMFQALANRGLYTPAGADEGAIEGAVHEGDYHEMPVFETNPDGVFCALQGRRLPAKRHPLGLHLRIDELLDDHVEDEGGDLWHRRIEEVDAAAAALAAHRFAVGHACWVGDPSEGVIVLPGSRLPETFSGEGVIPPVPRRSLPPSG